MKKVKKLLLKKGEGEHSHIISSSKDFIKYKNLGENLMLLEVPKDSKVTHEEHGTIIPKKGNYYVISQQEFDPLLGDFRAVFD